MESVREGMIFCLLHSATICYILLQFSSAVLNQQPLVMDRLLHGASPQLGRVRVSCECVEMCVAGPAAGRNRHWLVGVGLVGLVGLDGLVGIRCRTTAGPQVSHDSLGRRCGMTCWASGRRAAGRGE